jgi:transcriptional regulator with XRE-family HTH domain
MIGTRLKNERERLGMTQDEFANAATAKRRTLQDWERGVSSPTAAQLSALAEIGVDVLYVVKGERKIGDITPKEAALLDNFRNSPDAGKDAIQRTAQALAQSEVKGKAA